MRRAVLVLLVAVLSMSMLAFLAGCGGDAAKDEAKGLMKDGDAHMSALAESTKDLEAMQSDLAGLALGGDASALAEEAPELQEQVEAILDGMEADLAAAGEKYRAIAGLEGVQDYKDYASKMLEAVSAYSEQLGYTRSLVEKLTGALKAMAEGQQVDIITMMMDSEELKLVQELGGQGDALLKEADQIKLDRKLEN